MDIQLLVSELVNFFAPLLPYLHTSGEAAAEEMGKKFGQATCEFAKMLWNKLWQKLASKPAAQEAVNDVAADPRNQDAQAALRLQLKKLMSEDQAFADEIDKLLKQALNDGSMRVMGNGWISIQGNVSHSVINTGNNNLVVR